ncbi:MAG: ABC transporter permease [Helicobacter sp.]|uniref:ABC transporter permease n=1 Tax=Helicobacter sp. TaxID=218 RepID=UPI0025C23AAB|nr:ABC transporter permease [Helicobacter sp.]MCH5313688.1 ABC transporter permease [Helicobacter sp.]
MLFLIQKECKQILRNTFLPKLIFVFPIVVILVLPWATNMEIKNVNVGIVDFDKSSTSRSIIMKISSSPYFHIVLSTNDMQEAYHCIDNNVCDILLEFPSHFESTIFKEKQAKLGIYANAINGIKGSLGAGYLSTIIMNFAKEKSSHFEPIQAQALSFYRFNPHLDYKIYMIPALLGMVLTLICGFLPAFNIVGEKERGNIEQMNVTPISKFVVILSKLIPYWIIGLFVLSLCFLLAFLVYNLSARGSYGLIYLFSLSYICVVSGIGLIISNYSRTMQQAMFVIFFFMLILVLMSGLFTSIKSMPSWAYYLTYINPLRYFMESLRLIFLKGSSFVDIWHNFVALLLFAGLFNLWAVLSYKKRA